MTLAIIWDGMQATRPVGARHTDPVRWVPETEMRGYVPEHGDGTHVSRRTWARSERAPL
jgi:hypothetical protein